MYTVSMNRLTTEKRVRVIAALCEGCSVNATVRMTGVSKVTILKLLLEVGSACLNYEDEHLRGLLCERIEADEVWGFCHAKDKNLRPDVRGAPGVGSVWTWVAIDADSKLIVSWLMGDRDAEHARAFMHDLCGRLVVRPQLTTDSLGVYAGAVREAFGARGIDYAQVHKVYAAAQTDEARYSPAKCIGCERTAIYGRPIRVDATTSHVERSNLTLRMSQRRWTRLTNAHSKSFTHMEAAFALHSFYYNWCRKHATLGTSPAKHAELTDHVWTLDELVGLLEASEEKAIAAGALKRGRYKPRGSA